MEIVALQFTFDFKVRIIAYHLVNKTRIPKITNEQIKVQTNIRTYTPRVRLPRECRLAAVFRVLESSDPLLCTEKTG